MATIYHNPRCTKSRQTLALLEEKNIKPTVVEYLKNPLSREELATLANQLGEQSANMVRTKEAEYKEAGLSRDSSLDQKIDAIVLYPKLLERPIVVSNNKAAIGRPPEAVLEIL